MKYLLIGEESERMRFRKLSHDDFDEWLPFFDSQETADFIGITDITDPVEQCKFWFKRSFERYEKQLGGINVMTHKASGKIIGCSGLTIQHVDGIDELEIGYSILPEYRRQGYALEGARKCKEYAKENRLTESVISIIHKDNINSMTVAEKNGLILDKKTIFKGSEVVVYRGYL